MAQDRRIVKTKAAIREAFFSIMKENSSAKITVTEIANRANIDRKTFYLHYDSPEALMDEFYKGLIHDFLLILEKSDFFDRSFDVLALFQSLNVLVQRDIELYRHIANMPSYAFFWEEIKNIIKSVAIETMSDGVDMPKDELELYAEFYVAGIIASYLIWLRNEVSLTEAKVVNILSTATFYGFQKLLPQK
ncbi:TetR/AcrR family transcriptional regulator [Oscillibacter sp.]|uniref:TetR/AcrR family transcriptional regulator n=1 Tax=Oscillibacter sp. TaxID=1945593 RepID=UPI00289E163C|nr:TetR/AcrR family transcriptional regulator [Oscillibacter sp.]